MRLAADSARTCGLRPDGTATCWGYEYGGTVPGLWFDLDTGTYTGCGIRADGDPADGGPGTLACWGRLDYGLGTAPDGAFTQVSVGEFHACALRPDGTLACWGRNDLGQTNAPAGRFVAVTAGRSHTCAERAGGGWWCWGGDWDGQLGLSRVRLPLVIR
jgi:hypothetical protein